MRLLLWLLLLPLLAAPQTGIAVVVVNDTHNLSGYEVSGGLQYWNDLGGARLAISSIEYVTIPNVETRGVGDWLTPRGGPTLYVVDTCDVVTLWGGLTATGYTRGQAAFVTRCGYYGEADTIPMYTAHELGHLLYGLPDRGCPDGSPSIMGYPDVAYRQHVMCYADRPASAPEAPRSRPQPVPAPASSGGAPW